MMRASLVGVLLSLSALPVAAQEGLQSLVPLIELYGPDGSDPAFDVAGIRCSALYGAQEQYGRDNRAALPTRAQMQAFQANLDSAQQVRVNAGMGYATARESVEEDLYRVMDLYVDLFRENERRGRRWDDGPLLHGDIAYCGFLNG
jgi:hypothetical protein